MSNKIFDTLRYLSEVFIPAFVVFLGVVFANVPVEHSEAIIAIVGALGVFLGALINYKRNKYNNVIASQNDEVVSDNDAITFDDCK